jgi:hypothetical protein
MLFIRLLQNKIVHINEATPRVNFKKYKFSILSFILSLNCNKKIEILEIISKN